MYDNRRAVIAAFALLGVLAALPLALPAGCITALLRVSGHRAAAVPAMNGIKAKEQ